MARLSGNLVVIRQDVRDHFSPDTTIYWIGDSAHASKDSDHNPDSRGVVTAIDVMLGVGADASALVKACIGRADLSYVIHNRTIWSKSYGWKARRYTGADPHTNHVHISSLHTATADKVRTHLKWTSVTPIPPASSTPAFPGELSLGSQGAAVKTLQARLNDRGYSKLSVDGRFGPSTRENVLAFQKFAKISRDGVVGPVTWGKLWSLKIT